MKNLKKFTILFSVVILSLVIIGGYFLVIKKELFQKKEVKEIKIGFITDIHGYRTSKANGDIRDDSRLGLENFVKQMNEVFHPDFIVDGGDTIEGSRRRGEKSFADWKLLMSYFSKLTAPSYHVIGNHELRGFSKDEWIELNKLEKSYYYFDQDDLRVIVLDGNENEQVGPEAVGAYFMTEDQIKWLEGVLSESKDMRKIVFIHYPVILNHMAATTSPLTVGQLKKLHDLFFKNKVTAVFSGHVEILEMNEVDGVKYFVIPGQERSKNKSVTFFETFAEISIKEDVSVNLYYKSQTGEDYKTLAIPSEEYWEIQKIYDLKGIKYEEDESL